MHRRNTVAQNCRSRRGTPYGLIFFFVASLLLGVPVTFADARTEIKPDVTLADASSPEVAAAVLQERADNFFRLSRSTTQLIVNISVNKEVKGDFFVERDDAGEMFIKVEDIVALNLGFPRDRVVLIRDEKFISLGAVREVTYTFDERNLTVSILGKTTESKKTASELYPLLSKPQNLYYPRETSAFLNYGVTYSYADPFGFQSFTASNKIGARSGDVFFVSDSLYTKTATNSQFVRLQSSATYERRNDLQWLTAGDHFANSGDLGSTVNMGGIGFSKLYRLDPYFITQPVFNINGISQFPSEADIYLDGVLVSKQQIAPGSFELKNIYSYTGSHKVDVVLKDPFGNEQRISYPLYFSTQMLREGLHEYSYNIGFLREQYGTESNEYGKAAFSAFHRYGVTSAFNIGARAEGTDGVYNVGLNTAILAPHVGAFILSASGSSANGAKGSAASFQHSYQVGSFSTNVQLRTFSRDYATVAEPASPVMTRHAISLNAGFQLGPVGGFSLGFSRNEAWDDTTTRTTSANYSRALTKNTSLFATASITRAVSTVNSFFIGLNFTPTTNIHASAQYSRTGDTNTKTMQLQKDTPIGEGLGYRAALNRSDTGTSTSYGFNPNVQYNARYGIYTLDSTIQSISSGHTAETYNVSASGSIVYAGGFYGLSRPVNDSFSVVIVDSVPDTLVLNNGQEIGRTNASGSMIIPSLSSYSQNQIALDVKNMPMDYIISGLNQQISPPVWSGSCVSFDALKVHALTGTLYVKKDDRKMPLEYVDIMLKVGEREVTFPTGKNGEFYMENKLPEDSKAGGLDKQSCRAIAERRKSGENAIMPGTYQARVEYEGGACEFSITFPKTDDPIKDIGEVQCLIH